MIAVLDTKLLTGLTKILLTMMDELIGKKGYSLWALIYVYVGGPLVDLHIHLIFFVE